MASSLSARDARAIRAFTRRLIDTEFGGNVNQAAKRLRIAQSHLNRFLSGGGGLGLPAVIAIADRARVSVDTVLGRAPAPRVLAGREFAIKLLVDGGAGTERRVRAAAEQVEGDPDRLPALYWLRAIEAQLTLRRPR